MNASKAINAWTNLADKRVTVVGLGRFGGGVGLTRWLCGQGAKVTVSEKAQAEELADSVLALKSFDVDLRFGGHDERDFLEADLLVVNPAVPKDIPPITAAQAAGVPRTSEINLFLQRCPARIVGVTGSVGKSTTTAMTGAILACRWPTHVGGNIGGSLLEDLPNIAEDHLVVLELSSFQLEDIPLVGISPHVAVVTNLSANHLDRHGTMSAYADTKKNIFRFQSSTDVLILNSACQATKNWKTESRAQVRMFYPEAEPFELGVPGRHNQANAQAAWTAARYLGIDRKSAASALRSFSGLPHRLEFVAEIEGIRYFNDSKCTTPDGAIVALESFDSGKVVIIVGGYDKGLSFDRLAETICRRAKGVVTIGTTQAKVITAIREHLASRPLDIERADDLDSAVAAARKLAGPGDVVLLSPACASYDMFTNYEKRGEAFVELVSELNGNSLTAS